MISLSVAALLQVETEPLVARLALEDMQRFRRNEAQQLRAWRESIALLRSALAGWEEAAAWRVILEFPMRRLSIRIDAVLVTPRGVMVLEFKIGQGTFLHTDRQQVEDYALDLQDFHSLGARHPIVPILVASEAATAVIQWPLLVSGVSTVIGANHKTLGPLLRGLWDRLPVPSRPLDVLAWEHAAYRPVPNIVEAACTLYARHGVADIASSHAAAHNLTTTTDAILHAIRDAKAKGLKTIVFVTGIPGAGKSLCGLNAVFGTGRESGAVFLTGNPTLVHVLREALARDAAQDDRGRLAASRQRMTSAIQALPNFRDGHIASGHVPPEHVAVIDEAQRAWSRAHAILKSRDRDVRLTDSEPGHLLDIMDGHADWAAIVCLIGQGQEIHTGEGGLAEWGEALAARPQWAVLAAPDVLTAVDARQRLPAKLPLQRVAELHLNVPIRSIRNPSAAPWADAMLRGDAAAARSFGEVPFLITRDLSAMRRHLREHARGHRRAGLVASSGARRLRADGLGVELPHMTAKAVEQWFLNRWPDIRASDALEQVATEFSCQGLELDLVGLCWGNDLLRVPGRTEWRVRSLKGRHWQIAAHAETIANRINTYRVLLTRARYQTVIWVPQGDAADRTRDPAEFDAIAGFLLACGAEPLVEAPARSPEPAPSLI